MNWETLISSKRFGQETQHTERHDDRSEFKRDYDRLIFSAPFRRLQNKTQVFPLPGSVFVHNRLTHSLEVASVGMSLGCDVARDVIRRNPSLMGSPVEEIGTIVATACLAHDLGNPPFGHSGEKAIQTFFSEGEGQILSDKLPEGIWNDLTHFEGNANAFRILTHRYSGRRKGGFVMTYSMLASIVKYPYSSACCDDKSLLQEAATPQSPTDRTQGNPALILPGTMLKTNKFGFFDTEAETYRRVATDLGIEVRTAPSGGIYGVRHPLVYLVEAADDICYQVMDIEDAHKLKLISLEQTRELLLGFFDEATQRSILNRIEAEQISDPNEQVVYMRACVIGKLENECAAAFLANEEAIMNGTFRGSLIKQIPAMQREAYARCTEVAQRSIYHSKPVLDIELGGYKIMETLLHQMLDATLNPDRFYSKQLLRRVSSQYEINAPDLPTRVLAVIDFISGMTDVFALDFYQKINGTSLPIV